MMQDQKSFMLHWRSVLGGSSDIMSSIFAHQGLQYYEYGWMLLHSPVIIQDARPDIVDALMMLISMMVQGVCHLQFYLLRRPILLVWMHATLQPFGCWMGKTINRWLSIDAHFWAHLRDILTVIRCSTIVQRMHIVFNGSQWTVCMYYHLNPRSSRHVSFSATTIHVICMMNDVGPLGFSTFGRHFTA